MATGTDLSFIVSVPSAVDLYDLSGEGSRFFITVNGKYSSGGTDFSCNMWPHTYSTYKIETIKRETAALKDSSFIYVSTVKDVSFDMSFVTGTLNACTKFYVNQRDRNVSCLPAGAGAGISHELGDMIFYNLYDNVGGWYQKLKVSKNNYVPINPKYPAHSSIVLLFRGNDAIYTGSDSNAKIVSCPFYWHKDGQKPLVVGSGSSPLPASSTAHTVGYGIFNSDVSYIPLDTWGKTLQYLSIDPSESSNSITSYSKVKTIIIVYYDGNPLNSANDPATVNNQSFPIYVKNDNGDTFKSANKNISTTRYFNGTELEFFTDNGNPSSTSHGSGGVHSRRLQSNTRGIHFSNYGYNGILNSSINNRRSYFSTAQYGAYPTVKIYTFADNKYCRAKLFGVGTHSNNALHRIGHGPNSGIYEVSMFSDRLTESDINEEVKRIDAQCGFIT